MKLNANNLKNIIREVISEQTPEDETKLKSTAMSTSQRKQTSLDRISSDDSEFTSQEKGILDQIEGFLSKLAASPGVDMTKYRAQLERVMKLLQQSMVSTTAGQEQVSEMCGDPQPEPVHNHDTPCADDHEATMAKSDLYKLANYASELEQMIHDGEELEGWVQAKITKAADYLSSVKHYLEYEKTRGHE